MGKFKLDENLPQEAADVLRGSGHDAVSVMDQQMGGQPDANLAAVCRRENRAILTLDLDFADIRGYPPADYPGIVVLRLDKGHVLSVVQRLLPLVEQEPLAGKLWIVDETSIRVRG